MKKLLKGAILAALMLVMVVALTGCGNKLVATKTSTENGVEVKEKHELKFKGDKLDSIKMTYEFSNEASAAEMGAFMQLAFPEVEIDGKKVSMTLTPEDYVSGFGDSEEDMTKEAIKSLLEEEGYTVK